MRCAASGAVCAAGPGEEVVAGTLLDIVSALRNRYLETTFAQCQAAQGVLLARVWLGTDEQGRCEVDCIDSFPPYRQVIADPGMAVHAGVHQRGRAHVATAVHRL